MPDPSPGELLEIKEAIKLKDGEAETYISEIETIGQAYENMQTQNQHLLQQVAERDDYNIKLVSESVKTKQGQSFLLSEKHALAKQLQQVNTSLGSLRLRIAHNEEQLKVYITEALKSTQEDRRLAVNLETVKWELADAEKELKWLKSAVSSSEKEYEQIQRKMDEIQNELDNERQRLYQDDWEELQAKAVGLYLRYRNWIAPKVKYQETLLVDDVMLALMDSSRVNGTSSSSHDEGLVVRSENKNGHGRGRGRSRSRNSRHGKDRSKSRGKQDKSSIKCWYCKEIGHIIRKCPKRKDKKNGKKHVNNANIAEEDDKSSDGDLYLVYSVEQQEGNLLSGLFDGIVRTLGDVRYIPDLKKNLIPNLKKNLIPDLKKNLISLGTLDFVDCSISIRGRVMKVSKGAMVITKSQKTRNLYKLIRNTVIGGASVSTHVGSSNDNSELWHKRLGHLSEGGMLKLHKRKLL
ncbi:hypothetical protein RJ640_025756 [Escallonia rubra]|uniref:E3 ubiquitin protein ligase n=1 Tax=Escallonia rubra TaxID=112253 RepID=A0AA88QKH6_9ASTE|nr:hypothetical protein RJ640_025756 [Escallonia rubra]